MPIQFQDAPGGAPQLFWNALTTTSNNLGLSQLWAVEIDRDKLGGVAERVIALPLFDGIGWDITNNLNKVLSKSWFVGGNYCLMVQGVTFPGDSLTVGREGVGQTGMLKGLVGQNRNDPQEVTISFLETNNSITDTFLRPWMLMAGYKSLKDNYIRQTIKLTCFQKTGTHTPMAIRKQVVLHGAVPISIDSEEYNYTGDRVIVRQVTFAYNRYEVIDEVKINQIQSDAAAYQAYAGKGQGGLLGAIDGILGLGQGLLDSGNRLYTDIKGKSDRIQSGTTRFLNLIGEEETAAKVDREFNKAHENVGEPVADIIKTGSDYVAAGRSGREVVAEVIQPNKNAQDHFDSVRADVKDDNNQQ